MEFSEVVEMQVKVFAAANDVNYSAVAGGALISNPKDSSFFLNSFYPITQNLPWDSAMIETIAAHYQSKPHPGYLLSFAGSRHPSAVSSVAAVEIPGNQSPSSIATSDYLSCVRTPDLEEWAAVYAACSGGLDEKDLQRRSKRVSELFELQAYYFLSNGTIIGAASLVRSAGNAFLVGGFAFRKEERGGIVRRARLIGAMFSCTTVAMTDLRFAKALIRAFPNARILGEGTFVPLASFLTPCAPHIVG